MPDLSSFAADTGKPSFQRNWGQPLQVQEPIIDAARVPLSAYSRSWSTPRRIGTYLWLRLLRPLLTVCVWLAGILYAWGQFSGAPVEPGVQRLLWVYAMIIAAIFLLMLSMAPLRRMRQQRSAEYQLDDSSLMALADYIEVPPAQLNLCQRAKSLLVRHSPHGRLLAAMSAGPDAQGSSPLLLKTS